MTKRKKNDDWAWIIWAAVGLGIAGILGYGLAAEINKGFSTEIIECERSHFESWSADLREHYPNGYTIFDNNDLRERNEERAEEAKANYKKAFLNGAYYGMTKPQTVGAKFIEYCRKNEIEAKFGDEMGTVFRRYVKEEKANRIGPEEPQKDLDDLKAVVREYLGEKKKAVDLSKKADKLGKKAAELEAKAANLERKVKALEERTTT